VKLENARQKSEEDFSDTQSSKGHKTDITESEMGDQRGRTTHSGSEEQHR
jgi:hypothetical protein